MVRYVLPIASLLRVGTFREKRIADPSFAFRPFESETTSLGLEIRGLEMLETQVAKQIAAMRERKVSFLSIRMTRERH